MAKKNCVLYSKFLWGISSSGHIAWAQLAASLAAGGGKSDWGEDAADPVSWCRASGSCCVAWWTQKYPLLAVSLCEMDPNCGNLMKLVNCVRFPFLLGLLREQLGFFSRIWRVIQPWSSKSNHSLKSGRVSLAQLLKQKCITLKVH